MRLLYPIQNIHWSQHATGTNIYQTPSYLHQTYSASMPYRVQSAGHCYQAKEEVILSLFLSLETSIILPTSSHIPKPSLGIQKLGLWISRWLSDCGVCGRKLCSPFWPSRRMMILSLFVNKSELLISILVFVINGKITMTQ